MTVILDFFRRLAPTKPLEPGIYQYLSPAEDPRNYRLHLRLDPDGNGVLIINAATILHLNQTAAEYAYYLVHNWLPDRVARRMADRYQVSPDQARQDYQDLIERIQALINTPDLDPVTFLGFDRQRPFSGRITAPYRLDCALTYRLPVGADPTLAPNDRVKAELSLAEWKAILDKAWQVGIPHIIFTGGEPTLREDLPQLLAHTEQHGQVSGLLSDGLRLADPDYLDELLQTGLDHLTILLQPDNPVAWQALENALRQDLYVAVHLTISATNREEIPALLDRLAELGVKGISLSAAAPEMQPDLETVRNQVAHLNLDLVWNIPVPYSNFHPVALETQGQDQLEGAGRAWLYLEPDGDVLPSQGINRVLGNFLHDPWEKIWRP